MLAVFFQHHRRGVLFDISLTPLELVGCTMHFNLSLCCYATISDEG